MTEAADNTGKLLESAETLVGEVATVLWKNEETGYAIMRVAVAGLRDPITVVGLSLAAAGETVNATGTWAKHPKHGRQMQATSIETVRPTDSDGIERYLASGAVKGIGAATATKIVAHFGDETLAVLDEAPERLIEVQGLGRAKAAAIKTGWQQSQGQRQVLLTLAAHGIIGSLAHRIVRQYGGFAADIIRREPYRLAKEVRGVGFATADGIAMKLGIPRSAPERITAGLRHLSSQGSSRGHCGVPLPTFLAEAAKLLDLPADTIRPLLDEQLTQREFIVPVSLPPGDPYVFDRELYEAEQRIATAFSQMTVAPSWVTTREEAEATAKEAEASCGVALAPEQMEAVVMALLSRVSVLTGGPGTGKTSTLKVILSALKAVRARVLLGAPTGKAAKRMRESTGENASTVARLIGMGRQIEGEEVHIDCDILIVDEASMVDVMMLDRVLECLVSGAALLFVGDVDQLPSVGAGRVLADLIDSRAVATVRLTQIFRQAAESAIVRNAHRINRGEPIERRGEGPSDFYFVPCENIEQIPDRVAAMVEKYIPDRIGIPPEDVQVLSPMRRGPSGTEALNALIQERLNPEPMQKLERFGRRYGVGDRVLQTVNNYDLGVMNGESGIIRVVDTESSILRVQVDETIIDYPFTDVDQLDLAYAMTVHKAQGSQFPAIVMPLSTQHYLMLQRPIVYTGITRATRFCVIVGQERALQTAIKNVRSERRITTLQTRLEMPR